MKKKNVYITPYTIVVPISTASDTMDLVIGIHSTQEGIEVGAKENNDFFDFDESDPWGDDPWADTPGKDPWKD